MATTFKGGCTCGAVRYECSADPIFMGNCHCRECQRATGSAYSPGIGVPKAALKVTGEVKFHEVTGGSGKPIARGFCPNCGSRLLAQFDLMPDVMGIQAGSLDDPSLFKPMVDIFTASAQPWDHNEPADAEISPGTSAGLTSRIEAALARELLRNQAACG